MAKGKTRKGAVLACLLAVSSLALWGAAVWCVCGAGIFELDSDIADDATKSETDWVTVNTGPVATGVRTGVLSDPNGTTIFTGGGSKDTNPIAGWQQTSGSVPDKDNITNAYAYARIKDGELLIYFGADRFTTEGNANFGFWFFQNPVKPTVGGTGFEGGGHRDGDLLVVSGYEQGGRTPVIRVFRWVGDDATGHLELVSETNDVNCLETTPGVKKYVCATTNSADIEIGLAANYSPAWNYVDKDGNSQVIKPNAFIEGGINVTNYFPAGDAPCFTSFLVETRSSTSDTAQLKDFVWGSFPLCGLSMTKACGTSRIVSGSSVEFTFQGTVTNTGYGKLYNVKVVDSPVGAPANIEVVLPASAESAAGELKAGETKNWSLKYTANSVGVTNGAYATGTVGTLLTSQAVSSDPVTPVTCTQPVSAKIEISKTCQAYLEAKGGQVVVRVEFGGSVKNTGDVTLTGITLGDDPGATIDPLSSTSLAPGATVTYKGVYYPSIISSLNGLTPGRYWFDDMVFVATAVPALGDPLPAVTCKEGITGKACAPASCPICPLGTCATK